MFYFSFSIQRNVLLKDIDYFRKLTVIILHRPKCVSTSFNDLKVVISTQKTYNVQANRKRSKIKSWRSCSMKNRVKRKMNLENRWELIVQPFLDAYMPWEWSQNKGIGCRMNWSQETWKGDFPCENSYSNEKVFCIVLSLVMKSRYGTIILNVKIMDQARHIINTRPQNPISMDRSSFGGISRVLCTTSYLNQMKLSLANGIGYSW